MIGVTKGEDSVMVEFNPVFGTYKRWLVLSIPYTPKNYGEYGISFSWDGWLSLPYVWLTWKDTTYCGIKELRKLMK